MKSPFYILLFIFTCQTTIFSMDKEQPHSVPESQDIPDIPQSFDRDVPNPGKDHKYYKGPGDGQFNQYRHHSEFNIGNPYDSKIFHHPGPQKGPFGSEYYHHPEFRPDYDEGENDRALGKQRWKKCDAEQEESKAGFIPPLFFAAAGAQPPQGPNGDPKEHNSFTAEKMKKMRKTAASSNTQFPFLKHSKKYLKVVFGAGGGFSGAVLRVVAIVGIGKVVGALWEYITSKPTEEKPITITHAGTAYSLTKDDVLSLGHHVEELFNASKGEQQALYVAMMQRLHEAQEECAQVIREQTEQMNAHFNALGEQMRQMRSEQEAQKKRFEQEKEVQHAAQSVQTGFDACALAAWVFGDKETARKLRACGAAGYKMTVFAAQMETNPVIGAVGMATAITDLIDSLEDQEEDTFREEFREAMRSIHMAIEEAVRVLSLRMKQLTELVLGDIRGLRHLVGQQHAAIMTEFFSLHQEQHELSKKLQRIHADHIQGSILMLKGMQQENARAAQRHEEVCSLFSDLPRTEMDRAYQAHKVEIEQGLSPERFIEILTQYHGFIKVLASSSSLTGSHIVEDEQRCADALLVPFDSQKLSCHPVFSHMDLVMRLQARFLERELPSIESIAANPLILIRCIEHVSTIVDSFMGKCFTTQQQKASCIRLLQEIKHEIDKSLKMMEWLLKPQTTQRLIVRYREIVQELQFKCDAYEREEHTNALKTEMRDRLRAIAEKEIETIRRMQAPLFEKLRGQLQIFDSAADIAIKDLSNPYNPPVSRTYRLWHVPDGPWALPITFGQGLTSDAAVHQELWSDGFAQTMQCILEGRTTHWRQTSPRIMQQIQESLQLKLQRIKKEHIERETTDTVQSSIYCLVHPTQYDCFNLILAVPTGLPAPSYAQRLVALGLGTIHYSYIVNDNTVTISGWLKYNDIEPQKIIEFAEIVHSRSIDTDEDLYNLWYGGRFAREIDTVKVTYSPCGTSYFEMPDSNIPVIATCYYPSSLIHPGTYTSFSTNVSVENFANYTSAPFAASTKLIQNKLKAHKRAVLKQMLLLMQNNRTDLGKAGSHADIFYALLNSTLGLHQGALEPIRSLVSLKNSVRTRAELEEMVTKTPDARGQAFKNIQKKCSQPIEFNRAHMILMQLMRSNTLIGNLITNCTEMPITSISPPAQQDHSFQRLQPIEASVKAMQEEISGIRTELGSLKGDMVALRSEVSRMPEMIVAQLAVLLAASK